MTERVRVRVTEKDRVRERIDVCLHYVQLQKCGESNRESDRDRE